MSTIDLRRPGQRLPVAGSGVVAELIHTFNAMLARLEAERSARHPDEFWPPTKRSDNASAVSFRRGGPG